MRHVAPLKQKLQRCVTCSIVHAKLSKRQNQRRLLFQVRCTSQAHRLRVPRKKVQLTLLVKKLLSPARFHRHGLMMLPVKSLLKNVMPRPLLVEMAGVQVVKARQAVKKVRAVPIRRKPRIAVSQHQLNSSRVRSMCLRQSAWLISHIKCQSRPERSSSI